MPAIHAKTGAVRGAAIFPVPRASAIAVLAAIATGMAGGTYAQTPAPVTTSASAVDSPTLRPVTVSGTRTENKVDEVPATVTVITAREIEDRLAQDLRDLTRYEPNVSVANSPARFGQTGINIRGIEGNRILMQVDGVRLPDSFSIGSFAFATRDSIDLDLLKSVEILRGPGSSLYGSDALGGVVSFFTKDPSDLLRESKGPVYASAKYSHGSADDSSNSSATLAMDAGASVQAMIHFNRREGHETGNFGTNGSRGSARTEPNPQNSGSTGVLAKLVWDTGGPLVRFTVESRDADTTTDVATLNALSPKTTVLLAADRGKRERYAADFEWGKLAFVDALKLNVYHQKSQTRQATFERRDATTAGCSGTTTGTNTCIRDIEFAFDQEINGASVQGETRFGSNSFTHRLVYGADFAKTEFGQTRDGTQTIVTAAGVSTSSKTVGADVFPVRDFPISESTQAGLFVQDEILLANGILTLVPGIRYDRFKLDPKVDDIFATDNPGISVKGLSDSAVSPRIGALWKVLPQLAVYAQAAKGFRAPPYNDVNLGFTNFAFGYTAIPNPNLKAEKSQGFELGLRGSGESYSWTLTYFDNKYRDFIASLTQLTCPADPRCSTAVPITFQSINIGRVKINGFEARGDVNLDGLARGLKLIASYGKSRGENEDNGVPLASIDPAKAVIGLKYDAPSRDYGIEAIATTYSAQDRLAVTTQFAPPSETLFDLTGYYRFNHHIQVNVGVFNVGDRKYWLWSDVRGVSVTNAARDRFTQPGRNIAASVKVTF